MQKYALVENEQIIETITLKKGEDIFDYFHIEIAKNFIACPAEVEQFWTYDGENFLPPKPPEPPSVSECVAKLKILVDQKAASLLKSFIIGGPLQAMLYQEKAHQAKAYLAYHSTKVVGTKEKADCEEYALLTASLGIDGKNLKEVAQAVIKARECFIKRTTEIEMVKQQSKALLDKAKTAIGAKKIYENIEWPEIKSAESAFLDKPHKAPFFDALRFE